MSMTIAERFGYREDLFPEKGTGAHPMRKIIEAFKERCAREADAEANQARARLEHAKPAEWAAKHIRKIDVEVWLREYPSLHEELAEMSRATAEPESEAQRLIAEECNALRDKLLAKNRAYGNSALDPVRFFSNAPADEQIRVRLDDKLSRLKRGSAAGEDVEQDVMGYLVLLRVARRMPPMQVVGVQHRADEVQVGRWVHPLREPGDPWRVITLIDTRDGARLTEEGRYPGDEALLRYYVLEQRRTEKPADAVAVVSARELGALCSEVDRLRARVTALQDVNTQLVLERQARDRTVDEQVHEFHRVVAPEQETLPAPGIPSGETVRFRLRLVAEEFFELLDAALDCRYMPENEDGFSVSDPISALAYRVMRRIDAVPIIVKLPELADACADLDYVVAGLRVAFGINGPAIAKLVHAANMAKALGPRRADGKRMKPEGWKPADVAGELRRQGWQPGCTQVVIGTASVQHDEGGAEGMSGGTQ